MPRTPLRTGLLLGLATLLVSTACRRAADAEPAAPATAPAGPAAEPVAAALAGRLGCSASTYDARTQMYESQPRGSIVLEPDGSYAYLGFAEPSRGSFAADSAGVVRFWGGHLDGGEATPMEDRAGRFYVVFTANADNRWTCGRTDDP